MHKWIIIRFWEERMKAHMNFKVSEDFYYKFAREALNKKMNRVSFLIFLLEFYLDTKNKI